MKTTPNEQQLRDELRALDEWIAGHVMGWAQMPQLHDLCNHSDRFVVRDGHVYFPDPDADEYGGCAPYSPSTDPKYAMAVLEKCVWQIDEHGTHGRAVEIDIKSGNFRLWARMGDPIESQAETLPLAICRFARALFESEGKK